MSDLAERILKRIEELDTNPTRVSEKAGLSKGAVRDIVTGRSGSPSLATLEALCDPLHCSIGYLVGIEGAKPLGDNPGDVKPELPKLAKFWMVYGVGQRAPTFRHWSESSAKTEALRLAKQHPGIEFVVLEATSAVASKPVIIEFEVALSGDDIPF